MLALNTVECMKKSRKFVVTTIVPSVVEADVIRVWVQVNVVALPSKVKETRVALEAEMLHVSFPSLDELIETFRCHSFNKFFDYDLSLS